MGQSELMFESITPISFLITNYNDSISTSFPEMQSCIFKDILKHEIKGFGWKGASK